MKILLMLTITQKKIAPTFLFNNQNYVRRDTDNTRTQYSITGRRYILKWLNYQYVIRFMFNRTI